MAVWAIADLHLSFGVPNKGMEVFGEQWTDHHEQIAKNWRAVVSPEDLVLLAGDISWGMRPEEARADLEWIGSLPGTKVMIRGNHDFWWGSLSKVQALCPPNVHALQNTAFSWKGISIGGARLWDSSEYRFGSFIEYTVNPVSKIPTAPSDAELQEQERIFAREVARLELSLQDMDAQAEHRLVMTHYPPIGADLAPSRVSALLEKYKVETCVFGHLHNVRAGALPFGVERGVKYVLTSADYLDFQPVRLMP